MQPATKFQQQSGCAISLPTVNENGYYEIRLESIGGLGANLCGKLLGELGAAYLGLNAAAFSSYGSEKRGSPVKSYVRWSAPERDILHNSPIEHPHLLVLFHHALSKTLPVTAGVDEHSTLIVNTDASPEEMRKDLRLYGGTVCCVNALELALQSKSRVNMVMLGAIAKRLLFESGNELAAYAAKQINYHVMGYYPITPSTQIAEYLDQMGADGEHTIALIPAEGEHSAAGICYGASTGGGRVFNATSANGLLYALEQLPVQSGTRLPMVLNIACRTVSGPLSIKGDHSDVMYTLNTGWIILFADSPQEVYDCNICAIKIAEQLRLPVIVAFDGFFTSHQKRNCTVFADDNDVQPRRY